jgi:hypothetical protein
VSTTEPRVCGSAGVRVAVVKYAGNGVAGAAGCAERQGGPTRAEIKASNWRSREERSFMEVCGGMGGKSRTFHQGENRAPLSRFI